MLRSWSFGHEGETGLSCVLRSLSHTANVLYTGDESNEVSLAVASVQQAGLNGRTTWPATPQLLIPAADSFRSRMFDHRALFAEYVGRWVRTTIRETTALKMEGSGSASV